MAASFVGGAALGAAFGELLKVVVYVAQKTARFKSILKRLESTLHSIEPTFLEIEKLNKVLNRPLEETSMFIDRLENGKSTILKCSTVQRWNLPKKFVYSKKLLDLDASILRFFQIDVQGHLACYSRRILVGVSDLTEKTDRILSTLTSIDGRSSRLLGSCSVPELPDLTVGLDLKVEELKRKLLQKDASVVVVSAPGGCGKTTLAKMLCHDHEIKRIFGDNIFYVTVSKKTSLKVIVEKLFEHQCPDQLRVFQTDEEARNLLEKLIRQMRSDHMLLVLDDVWSGSESIIQNLIFQIPGYKVLVTSRFVFPRFSLTYKLKLLNDDDARTLFCYSAFPKDGISNVPDDLVSKMVKCCKGFPLALTVVGASLCGQPVLKWRSTLKKWSEGQSIFHSNIDLLLGLQTSIDALDELPIVKECFLDLGSFPEDQAIAATALMDMWVELYNLDEEGLFTLDNLLELSRRNLVNLVPTRKDGSELEGYCNDHYVIQHDLLRDLAIHLSGQEPLLQRTRLILDSSSTGLLAAPIGRVQQPFWARLLSISTDEAFSSHWHSLHFPEVEALTLHYRTSRCHLPQFMEGMSKLKVLIITNYGTLPAKLENCQVIGNLTDLRRIRFQRVSIPTFINHASRLTNLHKISFVMCELCKAFETCSTEIRCMLPSLLEVEIDRCDDLKELPSVLCEIAHLKKLSVTNCHELRAVAEGLGNLMNLEVLRLHSCTKLAELPESIGNLRNLSFLDISDCLAMRKLPSRIGDLQGLRALRMIGCQGLWELPASVKNLRQLEDVMCSEETRYLWEPYSSDLEDLKINVEEEDIIASFLRVTGSSKLF